MLAAVPATKTTALGRNRASKNEQDQGAARGRRSAKASKRTATGQRAEGPAPVARTTKRRTTPRDQSELARRSAFIVATIGNAKTAQLLKVAESQPSRWRRSEELPGPRIAPLVVDLDHVIGRLLLLWEPAIVPLWLEGANPHLTGARPIDVLRLRGSKDVIEAIDAEAEGAFA